MAKGENIFKRKDGRWEARYRKGREVNGKIKYGYCYGRTYREAKEKVEKRKAEIRNGTLLPLADTRQAFSVYCDNWLELNRYKIKESTYVKYLYVVEHHIKPMLGQHCPIQIDDLIVEWFQRELMITKGLSAKTVKDILVVLRSILKFTQKALGKAAVMPEIAYPKDTPKEMRVLSKEEQTRFMQYLLLDMDTCKFGILLTLFTGMRIGEICALKWKNIYVKEGILRVDATMQRLHVVEDNSEKKTHMVTDSPKSSRSKRNIPLLDIVLDMCEQMDPHDPNAYVLTGTTSYMDPRTLQYRLAKYCKACGLQGVHYHTLRHTFATRCVELGFEIKSLSEVLGHSCTAVTLDRYVHSSMELKRENMNKLATPELKKQFHIVS